MVQLISIRVFYCFALLVSDEVGMEIAKGAPPLVPEGVKTNRIIQEGTKNWKLTCAVQGDGPLLITWTRDGESITSAWPRFKQSNEAKYLQIKNVTVNDSGIYRCRATNGFGSVETEYTVVVLGPTWYHVISSEGFLGKNQIMPSTISGDNAEEDFSPPDLSDLPLSSLANGVSRAPFWIDSDPASGSLTTTTLVRSVNGSVRLKCHAAGLPKPDIIWLKDGKELDEFGWSRGKWALSLKDLRQSDSGNYTCKIFNIWGSLNASFMVNVQSQDFPVQFEQPYPRNATAILGRSATFQCRVRSSQKPVLQWIKVIDDPSHLDFNQSVEIQGLRITVLDRKFASNMIDFRNSTYSKLLYIPVTTVADAGWYVCVVTSQSGHLSHRFAYLNIVLGKDRHLPLTQQSLPLHIIIGIPVAFVLILIFTYAIYFLQKHKQRSSSTSSAATQPTNSMSSTAAPSSSNGKRPPQPFPSHPPPSLPPSSSNRSSPPHSARAMSGQVSSVNCTTSSDHSSATQQRTMLQRQPLLEDNGYIPGLVSPYAIGVMYTPGYKSYYRPQMAATLNGPSRVPPAANVAANQALHNGDLGFDATTTYDDEYTTAIRAEV